MTSYTPAQLTRMRAGFAAAILYLSFNPPSAGIGRPLSDTLSP